MSDCIAKVNEASERLKEIIGIQYAIIDSIQIDRDELLKKLGFNSSKLIHPCPFESSLSITFPKTLIIKSKYINDRNYREVIGGMIHESHHLCAKSVENYEFRWIGWEFTVAKLIDAMDEWILSMGNYAITNSGHEFGGLSKDEQSDLLEERVQFCIKHGMIRADGMPKRLATN